MSDLTEFLLTRIAEDEACVRDVAPWRAVYSDSRNRLEVTHDGLMIAAERVRAECEANRFIVARASVYQPEDDWQEDVLKALALPYADHPDYDEAWRP